MDPPLLPVQSLSLRMQGLISLHMEGDGRYSSQSSTSLRRGLGSLETKLFFGLKAEFGALILRLDVPSEDEVMVRAYLSFNIFSFVVVIINL